MKALSKDHSSSLNNEDSELSTLGGYHQYSDFKKREDIIIEIDATDEIYDDIVSATTPTFSMAMKSVEHEQPATFNDQGESSITNQLTWQDKIQTSDCMTLVRRPEDSDNSDYMTLVMRPESSNYMILVRWPDDSGNVYEPLVPLVKDSDSMYESLAYYRDMPSPLASNKDEEFQSTENIYQPLDL